MGSTAQHRRSGQPLYGSTHSFSNLASVAAPPGPTPNAVVGLGNEIAGDDGVGIAAARALEQLLADRDDVDVIALPWAGFALLDALQGRRRAAIIDCLATGAHPPGTIVHINEADLAGSVRLNSFHDISYPTAMALGRRMGWQMPDEIAIWGIEALSVDTFTEQLSAEVANAVQVVTDQVIEFLAEDEPRICSKAENQPGSET